MILVVSVSFVLQNPMSLYVDLSHVYYISEKVSFWHDEGGLFDWRKIKQEYSQIIVQIILNTQGYLDFFYFGGGGGERLSQSILFVITESSIPASTKPGKFTRPVSWLYMQIQQQHFWCSCSFLLWVGFWQFHVGN